MDIQLKNSEGKFLRQKLPKFKLGERIDKLSISKRNRELMDEVLNFLRLEGASEENVTDKYRSTLIVLSHVLNMDFDKAKREDIKKLNDWINISHYGWYRRESLRISLKKAFRIWKNTGDQNPIEVWDVRAPKADRKKPKPKKPKHLIRTNEEVDNIVLECRNNRDKFYVALNWNTAGRCIEIRTCKWCQIFEEDGLVKVNLKTAKESGDEDDRQIVLIYALPYYYRWKQEYKERFRIKNDAQLNDCYIFRKLDESIRGRKSKNPKKNIKFENRPVCEGYFIKTFKEIGYKLGLPDFTPKMFRKYTISRWERSGIPHALIKKMSGHAKNSRAIEHYSFHDEADCTKYLLQVEGVGKPLEEKKEPCPVIRCKRCDKETPSKDDRCQFCGFPLNENAIINQNLKLNQEIEKLHQELEQRKMEENQRWEKLMKMMEGKQDSIKNTDLY